jgi:glycosyltransferase involved in cell wall biosynthesis
LNGTALATARLPVPLNDRPALPPPTVSVITAVYNLEQYVGGCIESVLKQSLRDLEIVLVDDGSTDRSAEIIAKYAAQDPRVRGFRGPNRGVSHARNVAMQHARGRYFAILDSDDEWAPDFAKTLTRVLDEHPEIAVVSGNGFNDGGPFDRQPVRPWPDEPKEIRFLDIIEREDSVFIMSMFRREVFETIGGFNETLFKSEDYEYWLRATAAGFRILTSPEPLARYRRHPGRASADQAGEFESIMGVLSSAKGFRHRARADELGAIDRKLEWLQLNYLLTKGKSALFNRNFVEARSHFWELYRREGRLSYAAVSLGLRVAPNLVLGAYRARL